MIYSYLSFENIRKFNFFILCLLPIFTIFSIAAANFVVSFIGVSFIFYFFVKKNFNIFYTYSNSSWGWFFIYLVFCLYLIINPANFIFFNSISFSKAVSFIRFPLFFLALYFWIIKDSKEIIRLVYIITACIVFVAFDVIFQKFFGNDIFGFLPGQLSTETNIYSRFGGPFNQFLVSGSYLFQSILIITLLFFSNRIKYHNFTLLISLLFFATIISGERMSVLKLFLFLILLNIFFLKKNLKYFNILIVFFILTFSVYQNDYLKNKYIVVTNNQIGNLNLLKEKSQHYAHYYAAFKIFEDNKLFGTGFRSFRVSCKQYQNLEDFSYEGCNTHPHNFALEILAEQGLVGFLIFLSFICLFFKRFFRSNKVLLLYCSCYFIPFLPSGSYFASWDNINFWFYLSLYLGFDRFKLLKIKNEQY
jgi:O-antigen ligase